MDVTYLACRYEKGCKRVQEYMEDAHKYIALGSLQDALPDFIGFFSSKSAASDSLPGIKPIVRPSRAEADHPRVGHNYLAEPCLG